MVEFCDVFTGTVYRLGDQWLNVAYKQVATLLKPKLEKAGGLREAANEAASFWMEDYYSLIFPLRFCLQGEPFSFRKVPFPDDSGIINLESAPEEKGFRAGFLRGTLPPLLPVERKERTGELLADRLLIQAAMANLFLRQRSAHQEAIDAARLAFLTYPLLEHLEIPLPAEAEKIARFLKEKGELPYGLDPDLLLRVKRGKFPDDARVGLAQVAVQRIKRYVFETPGLNEIRGASTLLDDLTEQAKKLVSKELGPEVILRAVDSTIVFLAPGKDEAENLAERIREGFYKATGTAFAAAAWREVEVKRLFEDYQRVMEELQQAVEVDRAKGEVPITEALPFETRCRICRTRPAEGWTEKPLPGEREPSLVCQVCITKRRRGLPERRGKLQELLGWLGLDNPEPLGVSGKEPKEWVASAIGTEREGGFIPDDARPCSPRHHLRRRQQLRSRGSEDK